jgi:cytochrome b6-f complex iron-sulfur subunit
MERSEFLKLLGTGTLLACASCLESCSNNSIDPAPASLDFTIDLTLPENVALNSANGSLVKNGVIIARLSTSEFTALWRSCTHQGTAVNYQPSQQNFLCPNHQSKFDKNGSALNGPATIALRKYNTALTGSSLRVFS